MLFGISALTFYLPKLEADDFLWNGSVSTSWINANNWDGTPGEVPDDSTDTVVILDAAETDYDPKVPAASGTLGVVTINSGGILNFKNGSITNLPNSGTVLTNYGTVNMNSTDAATYFNINGSDNQTVTLGTIDGTDNDLEGVHFANTGGATKTVTISGNVNMIDSIFALVDANTAVVNLGSGTHTIEKISLLANSEGTLDLGISTATMINLSCGATSATIDADQEYTLNVSGNWDDNGATFRATAGTVKLTGASPAMSVGANNYFFNFQYDSSGGTLNLPTDNILDVNGLFTLTAGTVDMNDQNLELGKGLSLASGTVWTKGSGTLTFNGIGTWTDSTTGQDFGHVAITGITTVTLGSDVIVDNLTIDANSALDVNLDNHNITVLGDWFKSQVFCSFVERAGTVIFDGDSTQTITSGGTGGDFFNVTIANKAITDAPVSAQDAMNINGLLLVDDGEFDCNGQNVNVAGGLTVSSDAQFSNSSGTLIFDGAGTWADSTSAGQNFGNVETSGNNRIILGSAVKVVDLTIGATSTLEVDANNNFGITVSGDWNNLGTFNEQQGQVLFNGSSKSIETSETFYDFRNNGTITIATGTTTTISNNMINIGAITETGVISKVADYVYLTDSGYSQVSNYDIEDTIYIELKDEDENLNGTLADTSDGVVTITSDAGDSEQVTSLTETGNFTGIFRATGPTVALYDGSVTANDGILEVIDGDTIRASYTDAEDSSDNAAFDTASSSTSASNSTTAFTDTSGNSISSYAVGANNIFITVTDSDEDTNGSTAQTVSVTLTDATTGDSETITLTETGNNIGIFRNTTGVTSSVATASAENGNLEVSRSGDTITATYTDDDDPTDETNDTATMGTITVSGTVKDTKSELVVDSVTVELLDSNNTSIATTTTDASGNYSFSKTLETGTYTLSFTHTNFHKPKTESISVTAGEALAVGDSLIDPYGVVYDSVTNALIAGALVTLYTPGGAIYQGTPQPNPQYSDAQGKYNFFVEGNHSYYLTAQSANYSFYRSSVFNVGETIVEWNIPLAPLSLNSQPDLTINMQVNKTAAQIGDILIYTVSAQNVSTSTITNLQIISSLPYNFQYVKSTSLVDGTLVSDPTGTSTLTWNLSDDLVANNSTVLSFRVRVGIDAKLGKNTSSATVSGLKDAVTVSAGPSIVTVTVRESVFSSAGIIIGKVFWDYNGNGVQDENLLEEGISNVTIIMEDGTEVTTDINGKFSIEAVAEGMHVLRIAQDLPEIKLQPKEEKTKRWWEEEIDEENDDIYDSTFRYRKKTDGWWQETEIEEAEEEEVSEELISAPFQLPKVSKFVKVPQTGLAKCNFAIVSPEEITYSQLISYFYEKAKSFYNTGRYQEAIGEIEKADILLKERQSQIDSRKEKVVQLKSQEKELEERYKKAKRFYKQSEFDKTKEELEQAMELLDEQLSSEVLDSLIIPPIEIIQEEPIQQTGKEEESDVVLVGLAETEIGKLERSGNLENIKSGDNDGFEDRIYKDGRIAFYLKAKIKGKYLLTASLDTDKDYQNKLFEYINPDKYYPIYGDESKYKREAESQGKFYVKLETIDSYAMYGNFYTDEFKETEFSFYNRLFSGIKGHIEMPHLELTAFGAKTEQVQKEDKISARGISGPYQLSNKPVLEYSERLELQVLDKDRPDIILEVIAKSRDTDYEIDYDEGRITFKQPVASMDENGNPVYIVVEYEYLPQNTDLTYGILGLRGKLKFLNEKFQIGNSFIKQVDTNDYLLHGFDMQWELTENSLFKSEYAHSNTEHTRKGSAYGIKFFTRPLDKLKIESYYKNISEQFENEVNVSESGIEKYGLTSKYALGDKTNLIFDFYKNKSFASNTYTRSEKIELEHKKDNLYLDTSYEFLEDEYKEPGSVDTNTHIIDSNVGYKLGPKLIGTLEQEFRHSMKEEPGSISGRKYTTAFRFDYLATEQDSVYLRQEFVDESTGRQNITTIGMDSKIDDNTVSYVEHQFQANQATTNVGYNSTIPINEYLSSSINFERSRSISSSNQSSQNAVSVSFDYFPNEDATTGLKLERRNEDTTREYGLYLSSKFKPNSDMAFISKWDFQNKVDKPANTTLSKDMDLVLGMAFRPVNSDRLNFLAKYQFKHFKDNSTTSGQENSFVHIGSLEGIYDLTEDLEFFSKYALRLVTEDTAGIRTDTLVDLITTQLTYNITNRWDIANIFRFLHQHDDESIKMGLGIETGYILFGDFRLAAGYNFIDFEDEISGSNSYSVYGPYFKFTGKFTEEAKRLLGPKGRPDFDRLYAQIQELSPEDRLVQEVEFYYDQAKYWYSVGNFDEAVMCLSKGLQIQELAKQDSLAGLLDELGSTYKQANQYFAKGDFQKAELECKKGLDLLQLTSYHR